LTDKELVLKAKELDNKERAAIGDTKAFYKLFSAEGNFAFYFTNEEES